MVKRGEAVVFYIIAIAVLALAGLTVLILLMNPSSVVEEAPPCPGTCEQYCEGNEEASTSSSCEFLKPICCTDIFPDPDDDEE